jgi:hypothetical protein
VTRDALKQLEKKIAAKEAENTVEDPQAPLRKDVERLEVLHAKLDRELPMKEEAIKAKEEEKSLAEGEVERLQGEKGRKEKEVSEAQQILSNLKSQSTNRVAAFGTNIEWVLREIDKAKWHGDKPVGPIGLHVSLKHAKYKQAVLSWLGYHLCGFMVSDGRDRQTMLAIMQRAQNLQYVPAVLYPSAAVERQALCDSRREFNADRSVSTNLERWAAYCRQCIGGQETDLTTHLAICPDLERPCYRRSRCSRFLRISHCADLTPRSTTRTFLGCLSPCGESSECSSLTSCNQAKTWPRI